MGKLLVRALGECPDMTGGSMEELLALSRFSGIFSRAANANDVCRQLVHDSELGKGLVGSQLYALSDRGLFHQIGTYGLEPFDSSRPMSQFDENPLARAVTDRDLYSETLHSQEHDISLSVDTLPLTRDDLPVGAVTTVRRQPNEDDKFPDLGIRTRSNIGGLYLESLGIRNMFRETPANNNELTERQFEVLLGLARGDTNAQIAQQLILSESSIKQETVRIYRSLGVSTREQAVGKARATGLIPDGIYPPATPASAAAR